jgi:phosphoglycolate phosphatase
VRPTLVLFDIDGTLVHCGGAGRRALEAAMEAHLSSAVRRAEPWLGRLKLDGMTDRLIVREAMGAVGQPFDDDLCDRILGTYADLLATEIAGPGYAVLPGVEALLPALAGRGTAFGLCTGNLARGARIKLARGGLDRWFGFGEGDPNGFAEDGEARELIVRSALRRASALLGRPLAPAEALVVGDTPRDVGAARAAGCPVLAVATGRFGVEELRREGADFTAASLAAPEALALLLGS